MYWVLRSCVFCTSQILQVYHWKSAEQRSQLWAVRSSRARCNQGCCCFRLGGACRAPHCKQNDRQSMSTQPAHACIGRRTGFDINGLKSQVPRAASWLVQCHAHAAASWVLQAQAAAVRAVAPRHLRCCRPMLAGSWSRSAVHTCSCHPSLSWIRQNAAKCAQHTEHNK